MQIHTACGRLKSRPTLWSPSRRLLGFCSVCRRDDWEIQMKEPFDSLIGLRSQSHCADAFATWVKAIAAVQSGSVHTHQRLVIYWVCRWCVWEPILTLEEVVFYESRRRNRFSSKVQLWMDGNTGDTRSRRRYRHHNTQTQSADPDNLKCK